MITNFASVLVMVAFCWRAFDLVAFFFAPLRCGTERAAGLPRAPPSAAILCRR
jgi:hypothetical protein